MKTSDVGAYIGIDLSASMVQHGNQLYAEQPTVQFVQSDLNEGLAAVADEPPFDLYFCAYGSMSHLPTTSLKTLLDNIVDHAAEGSRVVMDLLGRNSLEWPDYWQAVTDDEKYADYSMSYLHRNLQK
ncbi:MAG: class I SAM-dependent methyltransferase [Caldilineaceae bacterium]